MMDSGIPHGEYGQNEGIETTTLMVLIPGTSGNPQNLMINQPIQPQTGGDDLTSQRMPNNVVKEPINIKPEPVMENPLWEKIGSN